MIFRLIFWAVVFLLSMLSRAQIPLDQLRGAECGMVDPVNKMQVAIPPSFTRVNVIITDAVAQVVVKQKFVNPFKSKSEVVYLFPLPDNGSVHGMKYSYHDTVVVAKILERAQAQAKYDSVKSSGGQAALLVEQRPNIFQQSLATMAAGDSATVEIQLSMPLKYVDGELELAFPTMIGPRFGSANSGGLQGSSSVNTGSVNTTWNPPPDRSGAEFEFNVLIQSGVEYSAITSPSHPITVSALPTVKNILVSKEVIPTDIIPIQPYVQAMMLTTQTTYPNKDFVLRLKRAKTAPEFSLATSKDAKTANNDGYFMLNLYPDPTLLSGARPDLEVIMLVDISGSQSGWPLDREKEITLNILSRLKPTDNLNLLAFSDDITYAFGSNIPVPANATNLAKGETFVRGLTIQGGTQLLDGVNAALAIPTQANKKRIFIFLTDGFITNETAILQTIQQHPSSPTIFTFGAGNSLNRYFLEECAKVGNGFATPVVSGDAVGPLVDAAWKRIVSPQLDNIQISFGGLNTSDILYPVSRKLYQGLPYQVYGKFSGGGVHTITLTGDKDNVPVTIAKDIDFTNPNAYMWSVPKLWAREKISQLSLAQGTTDANKPAILSLSLEYQVLSAYTAFLAVLEKTPLTNPSGIPTTNPGASNLGGQLTEIKSQIPGAFKYQISVHDGMFFLDWHGQDRVAAIYIYDLQGHCVFTYRHEKNALALSRWTWDGRSANGSRLKSGHYVISVQSHGASQNQTFTWN